MGIWCTSLPSGLTKQPGSSASFVGSSATTDVAFWAGLDGVVCFLRLPLRPPSAAFFANSGFKLLRQNQLEHWATLVGGAFEGSPWLTGCQGVLCGRNSNALKQKVGSVFGLGLIDTVLNQQRMEAI